MSTLKSIKDWTFDLLACLKFEVLCEPLLSWGKNLHPRLEYILYNMYVNLEKPTILYHAIS
jgi:hypothetical protein